MRLADFDYHLPEERIAQSPIEPRDAARLLVDRGSAAPEHRRVSDLPDLLREGDLLVLNDTKVIPARLRLSRVSGGAVEVQADVRARVWRIITVLPRINSYYLEGHGMKVGNYLPRYEDNRIEGRIAVGGEESNKYRVDESGVTLWGWVEFKRCRRNPT